ncbi:hypothetical protein FRC03_012833 [Tulasnella sp. 419]|nr:hypothetical protein FRC03_012833 [Tulasnella sp. 419]
MRGGASTIWDTPREPLQQRSVSPDPVKLNFTPMKKFKARISRVSVGAPPDLAQENEEEDEIKEEQPAASESLVKAPFGEISNSLKQSFGWSGKVPSKKTTTETKEVVKDVEPVASKSEPAETAPSKVGEVVEEKPAIPSKTAKPLTQPPNANVSDKEEEEEEIIVIQPSARVAANTEPSQNTGAARIFTIVAPSPVKASRPLSLEPVEPEAALNTSTKKRSLEADLPIESKEQVRAPSRAAPAKRPRVDTEISSSSAPVSSLKNSGRLGSTQPHRLSKFRIVSAPARMMTASSAAKVRAAPRQIAKPDEKPASAAPLQPTVSKAFTFTTDLRLESRKPPVPVQPRKPIVFEPKVIPDFALLHAALPPNAQYKAPTKPKPKPSTLHSDGPLNLKLGFKPTVPHTPRLSTIGTS